VLWKTRAKNRQRSDSTRKRSGDDPFSLARERADIIGNPMHAMRHMRRICIAI